MPFIFLCLEISKSTVAYDSVAKVVHNSGEKSKSENTRMLLAIQMSV